jgi:hypothetical protein
LFLQKKVIDSRELQNNYDIMKKEWLISGLFIVSLAGLLWSRAILSMSMGVWFIFSLWHFRSWINGWRNNPLLFWGMVPVILALLGIWQSPAAGAGWDHLLTLATYPVAALSVTSIASINKRLLRTLGYCWIIAALLSLLYPLGWYLFNSMAALERYSSGQSLPVFMDNDHVRFSIFLSAAALLAWFNRHTHKWLLPACIFLLISIIFLSARTGWAMVLVMGLIVFIQTIFSKKGLKKGIFLITCLLVTCTLSWFLFPTVQHKIGYSLYDWQQYSPGKYDPTLSDNARYAINKTAWDAIQSGKQNIGWANIPETLQTHFKQLFPAYTTGFGWPFNQWLFWWMGSGWWGMLLFSIWLFFPAYLGIREKNAAAVCWTFAIAASCLVETNLGYQYGVWLHSWVIIWKFVPLKAG